MNTLHEKKTKILSNGEEIEKIMDYEDGYIYSLKNPFCKNIPIIYILYLPNLGFYLYLSIEDIYKKKQSYQGCHDKIPNLKKYEFTKKMINSEEDGQNLFHYHYLDIGHINTTFYHYYDKILKKDIYTKEPEHTEYLFQGGKNKIAILLYRRSGEYLMTNMSKNDFDFENEYKTYEYSNYKEYLHIASDKKS
jgi:hypothetical protein